MKNDIEVGQIREFHDIFSRERTRRCYKIIAYDKERDFVGLEWLDTKHQESYGIDSTLLDRVISDLEVELL